MGTSGEVQITIQDSAASLVVVPAASIQVVIGTASSGTENQVVATRSTTTLQTAFTEGPLMQSAGLTVQAAPPEGGTAATVLAIRAETVTAGYVNGSTDATVAITGATDAAPIVITTGTAHGLITGSIVTIASVGGNTAANGTWKILVLSSTTFSLVNSAGSGAYTSGGTVQFRGVVQTSTASLPGTSQITVSGDPADDCYVEVRPISGGVLGVSPGPTIQISLDAGRNFGPTIPLGTATTYAVGNMGFTLNFSTSAAPALTVTDATNASPIVITTSDPHGLTTGQTVTIASVGGNTAANGTFTITVTGAATFSLDGSTGNGAYTSGGTATLKGTLAAGDKIRFSTVAPATDEAGVLAALTALQNSPYAQTGWGSVHIVGVSTAANAAAYQTKLASMATGKIFTGTFLSSRDASPPLAWGGDGETEADWYNSVLTAFSAASADRVSGAAGYYNMPSAFPTTYAGVPRFRRPLSWAAAARQATIPTQRHSGRVKDGPLRQIIVDPVNDPLDGFIYHDERINPVFDFKRGGTGRLLSACTRIGLGSTPGFYVANPLMLASLGSVFWMWPYRAVMDVACGIVNQVGQLFINDDLRVKSNGTLDDRDALAIKAAMLEAIRSRMRNVAMISDVQVEVDQTQQILVTNTVVITVRILGKAYVLEEQVTIAFANELAA